MLPQNKDGFGGVWLVGKGSEKRKANLFFGGESRETPENAGRRESIIGENDGEMVFPLPREPLRFVVFY